MFVCAAFLNSFCPYLPKYFLSATLPLHIFYILHVTGYGTSHAFPLLFIIEWRHLHSQVGSARILSGWQKKRRST